MLVLLERAVVEISHWSPLSLLELRNYHTEMGPFCGGEAPVQATSSTIVLL